jgi:general secretion pathway protein G
MKKIETKLAILNLNQKGLTLIEMLIVLALIVTVAGFVGGNLFSQFDKAKVKSTKIQIRQLGNALKQYRLDCNNYPTSEQGLKALIEKTDGGSECKNYNPDGYLSEKSLPLDAWSKEFVYTSDGSNYEIISLGNDGAEGGDGLNADISSNKLD